MANNPVKTVVIIVFFCLLFIPAASPENVVFNKTYSAQNTITLDTGDYTLGVSSGNVTTILITGGNQSIILDEGDCKRFGTEVLCHDEKISDTQARLVLYDLEASLTVTLDVNDTAPMVIGDRRSATIWINNTGEREAEDVVMRLTLPENLTAEDVAHCDTNSTSVYWTGRLKSDASDDCTFILRADGAFDAELQARTEYTTLGKRKTANSSSTTLTATVPIKFNITITDTASLEPAEPFTITFAIYNDEEDENLTIDPFVIDYDYQVDFISTTNNDVKDGSGEATMTALLNPNETVEGVVKLAAPYINASGTIEMRMTYNFTDEGQRMFAKTFPYQTIRLPLAIGVSTPSLEFEALSEGVINVSVYNPYRYFTFKGYDAEITWSRAKQPITVQVPYGQTRLLAAIPYDMPDVQRRQREELAVTVTGRAEHAQTTTATQTFPVTITPIKDVTIEKTTSDQRGGDGVLTVDVYATNNHHQAVTAKFVESFPDGVFARGTTEATKKLQPGERVLIYSYDVVVTEQQATVDFTTDYDYGYRGRFLTRNHTLSVDLSPYLPQPLPPAPANQTAAEATTTQSPSLLHVIIAAGILFLIVLIRVLWQWLRHLHTFKLKHKSILNQYQKLIDESSLTRKRKQELHYQQDYLRKKLDILEAHIKGYEHHLPEELAKLHKQEKKAEHVRQEVHGRHEALDKEMAKVDAYEKELLAFLKRVQGRERHLDEDKQLLAKDAGALREEQTALSEALTNTYKQQQLLADRIKHFKTRHTTHVHDKMSLLAQRKKRALDYHKQLDKEEELIKEEFKRLEHDLKASEQDLERAEKLYKESSTELQQGELHDYEANRH
ncbi:hypothetical protein GF367_03030 [Candidatus Woesearchaeota archaeon]|nr:hypothetical protein [Candidatus Woesearchaeota archaeon]